MDYENLKYLIHYIVLKPIPKYTGLNDILLSGLVHGDCLEKAYQLKILQMRIGHLWEQVFCLFGFEKLFVGADLIHNQNKIIMELKNSTRTDNASGRECPTSPQIHYEIGSQKNFF